MKATEAKLLTFIKNSPQLIIPIYQRTYAWTDKQCEKLWNDILNAGDSQKVDGHFVGSVVYIEEGLYHVTDQSSLLVIDGQQRLTTVTLILEALARALGEVEPINGFSAIKIREWYLINRLEVNDRHFKLRLSQTDDSSLRAIIKGLGQPADASLRITENFDRFQKRLAGEAKRDGLKRVCVGLSKLMIVDVALARGQDNPQLIFESMNSTGKELSQADLIRNFILMGLEPDLQEQLYEQYWRPMELEFGQEAYGTSFDSFMRHFLTMRTGEIPREREVYEAFKAYSLESFGTSEGIEALVSDMREFAKYFCAIALGSEEDPALADVFRDLREYKIDVAYPFLLELYADYAAGTLTKPEFAEAARLVESYAFRRWVCSIPTNSLNKTFATFMKGVDKTRYLESVRAQFLLLPSYRRFPSDQDFRQELQRRDLYNVRLRSYWLRKIENHGRKERVAVEEYTIEHILPQNPNLPSAWCDALGPDWKAVQEKLLHTLGNLTLTGYNSEYSDKPFAEKRDMLGGFRESPLRLNEGIAGLERWDEEAIRVRAEKLADQAVDVWALPEVSEQRLDELRPAKPETQSAYGLEDYENLSDPKLRELFETFSREVLALDQCATEEFKQHYIAYKAESGFVYVHPHAKRLRLRLNMPFSELDDPLERCRATGKGQLGDGDVELMVADLDDIPYAISMVTQSLERQLGDSTMS